MSLSPLPAHLPPIFWLPLQGNGDQAINGIWPSWVLGHLWITVINVASRNRRPVLLHISSGLTRREQTKTSRSSVTVLEDEGCYVLPVRLGGTYIGFSPGYHTVIRHISICSPALIYISYMTLRATLTRYRDPWSESRLIYINVLNMTSQTARVSEEVVHCLPGLCTNTLHYGIFCIIIVLPSRRVYTASLVYRHKIW